MSLQQEPHPEKCHKHLLYKNLASLFFRKVCSCLRGFTVILQIFDYVPFTFSHATEVMETDDWKRLVISHSNIVADAFRALASLKASPPIWGPPKKKQKPG